MLVETEAVFKEFLGRPFGPQNQVKFSNHAFNAKVNEACIVQPMNNSERIHSSEDESSIPLFLPNIIQGSQSLCLNIVFERFSKEEALENKLLSKHDEEKLKLFSNYFPTIKLEDFENDPKLLLFQGSAFLLNPFQSEIGPLERQTLYFATARHNICKSVYNGDNVIVMRTMYITQENEKDFRNATKFVCHPLIQEHCDGFLFPSDPDITFFKVNISGTRLEREVFKNLEYFVPTSKEIPILEDANYNVGINCISGELREVDLERISNNCPNITFDNDFKQQLKDANRAGKPIWTYGQTKGVSNIDNLPYYMYNCSTTPGCSGGACVIFNPSEKPQETTLKSRSISFIGVHKGFSHENGLNMATPIHLMKSEYSVYVYQHIKKHLSRKDRTTIDKFLDFNKCNLL